MDTLVDGQKRIDQERLPAQGICMGIPNSRRSGEAECEGVVEGKCDSLIGRKGADLASCLPQWSRTSASSPRISRGDSQSRALHPANSGYLTGVPWTECLGPFPTRLIACRARSFEVSLPEALAIRTSSTLCASTDHARPTRTSCPDDTVL